MAAVTSRRTALDGVLVIEPKVFGDSRGFFFEAWHLERYRDLGVPGTFVQDNVSRSVRGTLRGLHVQEPYAQGKLVQVLDGEVFDVAVDVRVGSPTFGRWVGERLSSENHRQMYVPPGFAHGFCVLSESALFSYKCTELYHPETEICIAWDDATVGIAWPITAERLLSPKDATARLLDDIPKQQLPRWRG
ncbi:MAG TPA: dTDP-4-dehydrorhamnose 3,5-epimerase [Vicinamibacterales bacterium]|jgi:dTDP-4-dehydrorhamnose 3,5-epimerase|nr:dTDP-4-dehydrorhamnose 3,5-epimerase [Vicinamibacterales bacterium]